MITCKFENGGDAQLRHVVAGVILLDKPRKQTLLTKRALHLPTEPGKWTLPAGYLERDQTSTDAALAETFQETGYEAKLIGVVCLVDSPTRPDNGRQNVGIIFAAQALQKSGTPDDESSEQKWFPLKALPASDTLAFEFARVLDHYKKWGVVATADRLFVR